MPAENSTKHQAPYPGLRPFEPDESEIFFGRAVQIDQMLDRLETNRFLAVVGASGSGKSSLVRAGLLPMLEQGMLHATEGRKWMFVIMRPGMDPFGHLASALHPSTNTETEALYQSLTRATLKGGEFGLIEAVSTAGLTENGQVLILVDQFEEIFRYRNQGDMGGEERDAEDLSNDAAAFVQLLLATVKQSQIPIHVVLTMRSDFIGDCDVFRGLPEAISDSQFLTPRLTRSQMREAISGPLRLFQSEAEDPLVNRILNDTGNQLDQLPLMQHALMRTWYAAKVSGGVFGAQVLRLENYEKIGGVKRSLHNHAEEAWGELTEKQRPVAERLFRCLSERTLESPLTRRLTSVREVSKVADSTPGDVAEIVEVFVRSNRNFIVVTPPGLAGIDSTLDIAHEALLRQWNRLQSWIDSETNSARNFRQLVEDANYWKKENEEWLWDGPRLQSALEWVKKEKPSDIWAERYQVHGSEDFETALAFLNRSEEAEKERVETERLQAERQMQAKIAQEKREAELQREKDRSRVRFLVVSVLFVGILALAAVLFGLYSAKQAKTAEKLKNDAVAAGEQALVAKNAALTAEAEAKASLEAANKATTVAEAAQKSSAEAHRARWQSIEAGLDDSLTKALIALEFLPDKKSTDPNRKNWPEFPEVAQVLRESLSAPIFEKKILKELSNSIDSLDFSPQGNLLAVAAQQIVQVWDISTEEIVKEFKTDSVSRVAFNPEGTQIVTCNDRGNAKIWNLDSEQPILQLPCESSLRGLAWSPNGMFIATGDDGGAILLWDATTGEKLQQFNKHEEIIQALTFSSDSRRLLSVSYDNNARIWDVANGDCTFLYDKHTTDLETGAWSLNGNHIATADDGGIVRVWNANTYEDIVELKHPEMLESIKFSPDGRILATGCWDDQVRFWDLNSGKTVATAVDLGDDIDSLAWSSTGCIATGSSDGILGLLRLGNYGSNEKIEESMSIQDLVEYAQKIVPRALGEDERAKYFLSKEVPHWCTEMEKPPFNAAGRLSRALMLLRGSALPDFNSVDKLIAEATKSDPSLDVDDQLDNAIKERLEKISEGGETQAEVVKIKDVIRKLAEWALPDRPHLKGEFEEAQVRFLVASNWHQQKGNEDRPSDFAEKLLEEAIIISHSKTILEQWRLTLSNLKSQDGDEGESMASRNRLGYQDALVALEFLPDEESELPERRELPLLPDIEKYLQTYLFSKTTILTTDEAGGLDGVDVSPDGRLIAFGSDNDTVTLWDVKQAGIIRQFVGHDDDVDRVAFSPDGTKIASGSADSTAIIWDVKSGGMLHKFEGNENRVWSVAWSPDGKLLAAGSGDGIRIFETGTGSERVVLRGHFDSIWDLDFSPDGSRLLSSSSDETARIWDVNTGSEILRFEDHQDSVYAAAWSPDKKFVATGGAGGSVRIWNAETGEPTGIKFSLEGTVWRVTFSSNGELIAMGSSNEEGGIVQISGVKDGKMRFSLVHSGNVDSISWGPADKWLVFGSDNGDLGLIDLDKGRSKAINLRNLIDETRKKVPRCFSEEERAKLIFVSNPVPGWCHQLKKPPFDAKGRIDHGLQLLSRETPNLEDAFEAFALAEELDPLILPEIQKSRSDGLRRVISRLIQKDPPLFSQAGNLINEAISLDVTLEDSIREIVSKASKESLKIWATRANSAIEADNRLRGFEGFVSEFSNGAMEDTRKEFFFDLGNAMLTAEKEDDANQAFHEALKLDPTLLDDIIFARAENAMQLGNRDQAILLALELDQTRDRSRQLLSSVLDSQSLNTSKVLAGHREEIADLALSGDGKHVATCSVDDTVKLWNPVSGELLWTHKHSDDVYQVEFTKDSSQLVSMGTNDSPIVYDVSTGMVLKELESSNTIMLSLAFSNDGSKLIAGSIDGEIAIWDFESGKIIRKWKGHSDTINSLCFNEDGTKALSGSDDSTARIWDVATGNQIFSFNGHADWVNGSAWLNARGLVATSSDDYTVKIWNPNSGEVSRSFEHEDFVLRLAISPDEKWLVSTASNEALIWDIETGQVHQKLVGSEGAVRPVSWSADGERVFVGSDDFDVRIYDVSKLHDTTVEGISLFELGVKSVNRPFTVEERIQLNLPREAPAWYQSIKE